MLRLPAERLDPPLSEPSQAVCGHWALVVVHQGAREIVYTALELSRKAKGCVACEAQSANTEKAGDVYVPMSTPSPMRSLTATKRVVFVRHGQGAHNRTVKNWGLIDPELDLTGEGQV